MAKSKSILSNLENLSVFKEARTFMTYSPGLLQQAAHLGIHEPIGKNISNFQTNISI